MADRFPLEAPVHAPANTCADAEDANPQRIDGNAERFGKHLPALDAAAAFALMIRHKQMAAFRRERVETRRQALETPFVLLGFDGPLPRRVDIDDG